MRFLLVAGASALALSWSTAALAKPSHHAKPDATGPIGVMGTHLHPKGEWMASYRYQLQRTTGLRSGSRAADTHEVMHEYGEAATKMDMGMHMVEAMVGITDDLTLMAMPQYMTMDMVHESSHGGGHRHTHTTSGFGDTEISGLYALHRAKTDDAERALLLNGGLSLPTGSINKTFVNHHDETFHLPYHMQFGSGTYDPIIGLTYVVDQSDYSWGTQLRSQFRLGKNSHDYALGNRYTTTAWIAHNVSDMASVSLRLEGEAWGDVSGQDTTLPITTIAGANPDLLAGERVNALIGVNLVSGQHDGLLAGHRLGAELGLPLYERYDGPQPDSDYRFTLGWHVAF